MRIGYKFDSPAIYNVSGKTTPVAIRRALVLWIKEGNRMREGWTIEISTERERL